MGNGSQEPFFSVLMAASSSGIFVRVFIAQYFYSVMIMIKNEKNEKYNDLESIGDSVDLIIFNFGLFIFSSGKIIIFFLM